MNKVDTIAIIRSLLSSTRSFYTIYNLNKDFKNETGIDIPLFGYSNVSDFLNSIPDTVKVTGIYPVQHVSLVTSQKSSHIVSLVKRQKNCGQKKNCFLKSKTIVNKAAMDARDKEIQGSHVILDEKGIDDFRKSYDSVKEKASSLITEMLSKELNLTLPLNPSKGLIPFKDFWCTQESIPSIDLELHARVGEYVEVCPCQIFSPHKFYFQFRMFKKKFQDFLDKLQIFYSKQEIPNLNCELAKPKQLCAAFYKIYDKPRWHRAVISEIISNSRVNVNFIDFGKTAEVSIENIKFLHKSFVTLPRQAVLGFLANIKPLQGRKSWSPCATKTFYKLAFRKALVAGVVVVDSKSCCLGMALSCTKGPEIHINDTLVKEGYADFDLNVLNNHFTGFLKNSYWSYIRRENFDKSETITENINFKKGLSGNSLKKIQSSFSIVPRTPVYFWNNNDNNNNRLKKMFYFDKE